uniref:peptidylprolyl isomerase n=1 Tax=Mesocestoides corti TaxID=53468 RepID=A0A5K3FXW4_MESCO
MLLSIFCALGLSLFPICVECLDHSKKLSRIEIGIILSVPTEACHATVEKGDEVSVTFVGRLLKDNTTFASNADQSRFTFKVGAGTVIEGWDKGILGMCVHEKRRIFIPGHLGYGALGRPPDVPGDADLVFDVVLLELVKAAKTGL